MILGRRVSRTYKRNHYSYNNIREPEQGFFSQTQELRTLGGRVLKNMTLE
jgi:hypothetical protein